MISNRPTLRVLIGAPGSGKSTHCQTHAAHYGTVLSIDETCRERGATPDDRDVARAAAQQVMTRAETLLAAGAAVTIDATSTRANERASWLAIAGRQRAVAVAVVLTCTLATARQRNAARPADAQVPDHVLTGMWHRVDQLRHHTLYHEGFVSVRDHCTDPEPQPQPQPAEQVG